MNENSVKSGAVGDDGSLAKDSENIERKGKREINVDSGLSNWMNGNTAHIYDCH